MTNVIDFKTYRRNKKDEQVSEEEYALTLYRIHCCEEEIRRLIMLKTVWVNGAETAKEALSRMIQFKEILEGKEKPLETPKQSTFKQWVKGLFK